MAPSTNTTKRFRFRHLQAPIANSRSKMRSKSPKMAPLTQNQSTTIISKRESESGKKSPKRKKIQRWIGFPWIGLGGLLGAKIWICGSAMKPFFLSIKLRYGLDTLLWDCILRVLFLCILGWILGFFLLYIYIYKLSGVCDWLFLKIRRSFWRNSVVKHMQVLLKIVRSLWLTSMFVSSLPFSNIWFFKNLYRVRISFYIVFNHYIPRRNCPTLARISHILL